MSMETYRIHLGVLENACLPGPPWGLSPLGSLEVGASRNFRDAIFEGREDKNSHNFGQTGHIGVVDPSK